MEIKHIGSGEGAKALIYYIMDYITKASLLAHVGLCALLYAINRSQNKYKDEPGWEEHQSSGALTVLVNSMMARQEISHQQVMSYLIGGGDHYTSDKFRVLHYSSFEQLISRHWLCKDEAYRAREENGGHPQRRQATQSPHCAVENTTADEASDVTGPCVESLHCGDDSVTLFLGAGSISIVNQQQDYIYRPFDKPFASMGLYKFIRMTEKLTKDAEFQRILRRQDQSDRKQQTGWPKELRGELSPEHPQYAMHMICRRTIWVIPVLLGEQMPRLDRGNDEWEKWVQSVPTLFIPWKHPADLKYESETWSNAYE